MELYDEEVELQRVADHCLAQRSSIGCQGGSACRKYGISDETCHKWKSAYGGMDALQLKQLKDSKPRTKRMYAELALVHTPYKTSSQKNCSPGEVG